MNTVCKNCGHAMTSNFTIRSYNWTCDKCQQYSVVCLANGSVESETLRSGNFYIVFMPVYKTASVVSTEETNKKVISSFDMEEFTSEEITRWNKKLKTYVLFQ